MEPLGRPLLVPCHCRNASVCLWLRRSRVVSVLQLHEGEVVGRKTCVKALLCACLQLDSRPCSLAEVLQLALAQDGKNRS